jgi:hypothetical protein
VRSAFAAFLRGFVLPFGVTSGRRIFFDGTNGVIQFYDDTDALRIQIGGAGTFADSIAFSTGDVEEDFQALLNSFVVGAGANRGFGLQLTSPGVNVIGADESSIELYSPRIDSSGDAFIRLNTNEDVEIRPFNGVDKVIPRGLIQKQEIAANSAAHADLAVTDFALTNLRVYAGHTYRFWLHSQWAISAVASTWIFTLNVNGVVTERFETLQNQSAVALAGMTNSFVDWVAPTSQATDDFAVGVDETTATAATLTFQASASVLRTFSVEDLGVL